MATAAERMRRVVERRKERGECPRCGQPNDRLEDGGYECSDCTEKQSLLKKKWVQERIKAGLCPNCNSKLDRKGWKCSKCHAKVLESNKKCRKKRSA